MIEQIINMNERTSPDGLVNSQQKRLATISIFPEFMITLGMAKGKGMKIKRELKCFLMVGATKVFETEEDEYQYIRKYGRGMWTEGRLKTAFNEDEMVTIRLIAEGFGAFDY